MCLICVVFSGSVWVGLISFGVVAPRGGVVWCPEEDVWGV